MKEYRDALQNQFNANKNKNLLFKDPGDILNIDPLFLEKLGQLKREGASAGEMEELVEVAVNGLIGGIHGINQYIYISPEKQAELRNIYICSWEAFKSEKDSRRVLYEIHYPALSQWLNSVYPALLTKSLINAEELNPVVCAEYSAEFQKTILLLESAVLEPVLDVGCGKNSSLVKSLRESGIDATGIDRAADGSNPFLIKSDWFEYDFGVNKWGTVISNAAFSNHLIYSSIYDQQLYRKNRQIFNDILNSLKKNGSFIYAPGLPPLESPLDKTRFSFTSYPVTGKYTASKIVKLRK